MAAKQGILLHVCDSMSNFRHPDLAWRAYCFTLHLNPKILVFTKILKFFSSLEMGPSVF